MAAIPPAGGDGPFGMALATILPGADVEAQDRADAARNAGNEQLAAAMQINADLPPAAPWSTPAELAAHVQGVAAQIQALRAEDNQDPDVLEDLRAQLTTLRAAIEHHQGPEGE